MGANDIVRWKVEIMAVPTPSDMQRKFDNILAKTDMNVLCPLCQEWKEVVIGPTAMKVSGYEDYEASAHEALYAHILSFCTSRVQLALPPQHDKTNMLFVSTPPSVMIHGNQTVPAVVMLSGARGAESVKILTTTEVGKYMELYQQQQDLIQYALDRLMAGY